MAEAKDKAMWFGVDDGVRRYDGVTWTAYTEKDGLYGAPVQTLCATRDGSVYAGTDKGVSRFKEGKWQRGFPPTDDPSTGSEQALLWYVWSLMEARDGSLWAGTEWGALRLGQEGSTLYTTEQVGSALRALASYVRLSIVPDEAAPALPYGEGIGILAQRGLIWKVVPGGPGEAAGLKVGDHILAVDGDSTRSWVIFGPLDTSVRLIIQRKGRPDPFEVTVTRGRVEGTYRELLVYDVYEDREGAIWFGLFQGEIVRYVPSAPLSAQRSEWRLFTEKDGLDIGTNPHILQTRDRTIWTVSAYDAIKGVNRFDGKAWTHFRLRDLGGDDDNFSILETRDGVLWVGGHGGHLHACRNGLWTVYRTTPDVPIPTNLNFLLEASDGALWVAGTGQEVVRLDYGTARWSTYEDLNFQCETLDGSQWFRAQDSSVVRYDGRRWTRYGVEDGLMDTPNALLVTRKGIVWAAGSHDSTAATAQFNGKQWSLQTHPRLALNIVKAVYESSDGAVWFGAENPISGPGHLGGVLRFDGNTWTHYTPPQAPMGFIRGIGQTADGLLWFGTSQGLGRFDPLTGSGHNRQAWTRIREPENLSVPWIDVVHTDPKGDLWVGTRYYGAFHYDGKTWTRYDVRDGLADNNITGILQTADGSVYVGTGKGISRFDGRSWTTYALSQNLRIIPSIPFVYGSLRQSRDGALWINSASREGKSLRFRTTRYQPDLTFPETAITLSLDRVSQPGNTVLAWTGADPWKATPDEEIQYSHRLDGGEWSPFSMEKSKVFLSLPSGNHTFEVRARDRDFNVDPTPAAIRFTVVPPVWRQPWFIGLMAALLGATIFQTARVFRRDRRLSAANENLTREMEERQRAEEERLRLDERLQEMRYLYRLRSALGNARSSDEVFQKAGEALMEVLSLSASAGVLIEHDGRTWRLGETDPSPRRYERLLSWGGKQRGNLILSCGVELSEAQERTLLDETAGQVASALEAKELEAQILQSARLVSLGQMAAGVAHELNQPLTAISNTAGSVCVRLAEKIGLSEEELKAMMQDVLGLVDRMSGTIDHLRVFSRDKSQEPGYPFSINEAIHASLRLIEAQLKSHGIALHLNLSDGLPSVSGHPHQMEQVFLNLLRNARDALDEKEQHVTRGPSPVARENPAPDRGRGGDESRVTNHEPRGWKKRVVVRTRREGDEVVAEVEDNGTGIDEADRARLFEPFFTTKPTDRGTGLGLSISYAIVKNHGGQITCESRKGEGTTFRVRLPVSEV